MEPLRPLPRPTLVERLRAVVEWVRLPRLLAMVASVLIVAAGSWWLLRSPAPPVEQSLPFAASSAAKPPVTARYSSGKPAVSTSSSPPAVSTGTATTGVPSPEPLPPVTALPTIVVQAAGAVLRPGVYTMTVGSRVNDLIVAAGGPNADADAQSVNLAAPLVDGQRIYLPRIGEPPTTTVTTAAVVPPVSARSSTSGPVDINHADATTIDLLPGIGPSTAAAIVAYREANGPFASPDELLKVRGIGPAKLAVIRGLVMT